jgi:8-oxo-dGTP diphosphatase
MPPFVSTSAVATDGDRILAVIDPIRGEPVLPGGHLKWREVPERALSREVYEETGYSVVVRRLIGVFGGEVWSDEPGVVRIVYEAAVTGGALTSSAEGEACWLSIADFLAMSRRDAAIVQRWREPGAP